MALNMHFKINISIYYIINDALFLTFVYWPVTRRFTSGYKDNNLTTCPITRWRYKWISGCDDSDLLFDEKELFLQHNKL